MGQYHELERAGTVRAGIRLATRGVLMSLHCPTCGAADDETVNGWVHRAQAAEAMLERVKQLHRYTIVGFK